MPRSLVSPWKRVAVSGPTVDGREIFPQELIDLAETYNPSFYTASIWLEHERGFGTFGTVYALRLAEDTSDLQPGEVALEARLKPNDKLLQLNDLGEKLFTSIEIRPNFRKTGRNYLGGLAVTDEPASVGTQELYFTARRELGAERLMTAPRLSPGIPLDFNDMSATADESNLFGALARFFKRFAEQETAPSTDNPTEKTPMDEVTAKAAQGLVEQLLVVAAGIQALVDASAPTEPEADADAVSDVKAAVDTIVAAAQEEKQLSRRQNSGNQAVLAGQARIEKMFQALLDTPKGRQFARTTGDADKKKRVL
ncbi:phage capsid scaffolding protein (GPO) serine peptidase [Pseudomonas sp. StFLB209]|uniref:GPO family capsid scaffolding protein n=1 Tax=Pseudomonas sp. StFLB209 TaxID=1028989 RepID=UPI0004F91267|nr:GPO family capsid scaffolding protein [Pseudomonas sp. StFLB209]BAP43919.1 phage capsid scaffolding protein (GPO) serine peptidase [Pseudomonas sp. StFLB209]